MSTIPRTPTGRVVMPYRVAPAPGGEAVILTCFNAGAWIEEALASVLARAAADAATEIVVADDGSDAASPAVLDRLTGLDPRIIVPRHQRSGMAPPQARLFPATDLRPHKARRREGGVAPQERRPALRNPDEPDEG